MSHKLVININKFNEYKGRDDVKHNSWFRCSNRLLEDPDLYEFSASEKVCWIYFLSLSSQKNSANLKINFGHAAKICNITADDIISCAQKLSEYQIVEILELYDPRNVDVTCTVRARVDNNYSTGATDRQTDITDITNTTNKQSSSVAENSASLVPSASQNNNLPVKVEKPKPRSPRETFSVNSYQDFDQIFTLAQKQNYYALYPDITFLNREFRKIHNWLIANPRENKKTFKGWSQRVSTWLDSNWPKYQQSCPKNKADNSSVSKDELNERIKKLFGEAV